MGCSAGRGGGDDAADAEVDGEPAPPETPGAESAALYRRRRRSAARGADQLARRGASESMAASMRGARAYINARAGVRIFAGRRRRRRRAAAAQVSQIVVRTSHFAMAAAPAASATRWARGASCVLIPSELPPRRFRASVCLRPPRRFRSCATDARRSRASAAPLAPPRRLVRCVRVLAHDAERPHHDD